MMKITYDLKADAMYIRLTEKRVQIITQCLTEDVAIDYGPKGEVVGIEILSAHEHLHFSGKQPQIKAENLTIV